MQYVLKTPLSKQDLAPLKAGDTVLLSGVVYTARDAAHARMMELLDKGEPLPFPIEGAAIYYVGPTPERPGCAIGAAGPTTSGRMDAYTPRLLDLGLACMIGKGKRTDAVKQSVVKNGAVYLAAIGGAGALMAGSVQSCEIIAWPDLGCEAVRKLVVKNFPLTVLLTPTAATCTRAAPLLTSPAGSTTHEPQTDGKVPGPLRIGAGRLRRHSGGAGHLQKPAESCRSCRCGQCRCCQRGRQSRRGGGCPRRQ